MRKLIIKINGKAAKWYFRARTVLCNSKGAVTYVEVLVMVGIVLVLAAIVFALFKDQIDAFAEKIGEKIEEIFNYS